ncbi:hypothetical protein LBBP_03490 [Leptospira borgpetersenii serovar Ballum]|uniref:Uncharacterized protein n=1 Tax=Leptospira borgpetersenii serovar Ballum TaxID=280505 RepID=A0A0S2IVH9_LEPBO|nr:hypothetical protein LBBP_03490 [Leptospira borgpetersenii serovar Ballum]
MLKLTVLYFIGISKEKMQKKINAKDLQEVFSQRYRSIAPNPECRLFEEN